MAQMFFMLPDGYPEGLCQWIVCIEEKLNAKKNVCDENITLGSRACTA